MLFAHFIFQNFQQCNDVHFKTAISFAIYWVNIQFWLGICEPSSDSKKSCLVDPLSSLIYAHAIHWTVHLVADQILKSRHKVSR